MEAILARTVDLLGVVMVSCVDYGLQQYREDTWAGRFVHMQVRYVACLECAAENTDRKWMLKCFQFSC